MQALLMRLPQKIRKPLFFGICGAVGCAVAATVLGEVFLALTKLPPTKVRSPQAVVLLIDASGSMNGEKLQEVKTAAASFVKRQDLDQNRIAVVGFGSNVQIGTSLSGDSATVDNAIAQLNDGGSTAMDIGIQAATQELQSTSLPRNILLFTDGAPDSIPATFASVQASQSQKVKIIAVATGDADTNFLTQLTGNPSLVFYANSGQFDSAFEQAEKIIYGNQLVESGETGNYGLVYAALRIGGWTAILAIGTSLALLIGQNYYLRRSKLLTVRDGSLGTIGSLVAGIAAGAVGQMLFTPVAGIPIVATIGRLAGWTILGTLVGGGMSFFVPNLALRRALVGGGVGGAIGAIGFLVVSASTGDLVGRLVGAAILGFFIGLMIALIEALSREAWLIVHWTAKEQTTISLGAKPVILGSSDNAHIYLRKDQGYPPITAKIFIEGDKIVMQYDESMQQLKSMKILTHELADGQKRKLGDILIEVKTATGNQPPQFKQAFK